MGQFILFLFFVILADGKTPDLHVEPFATMEQCDNAAKLAIKEGEAAVKAGDLSYYMGACLPVDQKDIAARLGKEKEGSI